MPDHRLCEGQRALIFGVANERSIAWGIARVLHEHGARLAFTFAGEALEKRVRPLAAQVGADLVLPCDVTSNDQLDQTFAAVENEWGGLDILVHSIAFAEKSDLEGRFMHTSRDGFLKAQEISAYSLVELARRSFPLMSGGGSIVTLSYYGAEKAVPNYNVMGVAKASLEACVRYLAADLGADNIRVNAISAGPVRTLAASGVRNFKQMMAVAEERSPLKRNITQEEVGNAALYLLSPLGTGVTGEVLHVDAGFHVQA
jgi:enoyl-[acyl-carrier protein] reductase I